MTDDVTQKVIEIIADQALLDPSDVKISSTPEELGLDSLGLVEIVFAIEESFDVSVPYNANDPSASDFTIDSVQTVVDGVKKLLVEQA